MLADMTGIPVKTLAIQDNAALGAAMLAGIGAGLFADLSEACQATLSSVTHFEPEATKSDQYNKIYSKYLQLYQLLEVYW